MGSGSLLLAAATVRPFTRHRVRFGVEPHARKSSQLADPTVEMEPSHELEGTVATVILDVTLGHGDHPPWLAKLVVSVETRR
jgi:hypothetical protein